METVIGPAASSGGKQRKNGDSSTEELTDHVAIIKLWPTYRDLAREIGIEDPTHIGQWVLRGRIPDHYHHPVVEAAKKWGYPQVTYRGLAIGAAEKRKGGGRKTAESKD